MKLRTPEDRGELVQGEYEFEKDRRRAQDEELNIFASKVIHKEGRTKNRTDKTELIAMKELIELDVEIKSARNINATYDDAIDRIDQAANARMLPGFQRQQENYKPGQRYSRYNVNISEL